MIDLTGVFFGFLFFFLVASPSVAQVNKVLPDTIAFKKKKIFFFFLCFGLL